MHKHREERIMQIEKVKQKAVATQGLVILGKPKIVAEEYKPTNKVSLKLQIPIESIVGEVDGISLLNHYEIKNQTFDMKGDYCDLDVPYNQKNFNLNDYKTNYFVQRIEPNPYEKNNILSAANADQYYLEYYGYFEDRNRGAKVVKCTAPEMYMKITADDFKVKELTKEEISHNFDERIQSIREQYPVESFWDYLSQE